MQTSLIDPFRKARPHGRRNSSEDTQAGVEAWNRWREDNAEYAPDLRSADLYGASLNEADLSYARCEQANFSRANLTLARLLDTNLDGATLTGARLWETQRAGWSIRGVACESVYWDKDGKELTTYGPGEFERLYSSPAEFARLLGDVGGVGITAFALNRCPRCPTLRYGSPDFAGLA